MPEPGENETQEEYMGRCIPMVMDEGKDNDQAVAICMSKWKEKKAVTINAGDVTVDIEDIANTVATKVGARHSAKDTEALQAIHDGAIALGAVCPPPKPEIVEIPFTLSTETLVAFGNEVKALGDGKVGGYLVRFSDENTPDLTGDFFTRETDFGQSTRADVYYQHGMDKQIGKRVIGSGETKADDVGLWIDAQLNLRDEYERAIYELAEAGKLGWSSGTAPHLVERKPSGKATQIVKWPLGLDASLTPTPAEPRNTVIPLKSLFPQPELPEGAGDAPVATAPADETTNVPVIQGEKKMEKEELQQLVKDAAEQAVKAFAATLPPTNQGGHTVEVVQDEADRPFTTLAEECQAVKSIAMAPHGQIDARLKRLDAIKAPTGAFENAGFEGGYLLEPTLAGEFLKPVHETGPFSSAVRRLPVQSNSNYGWLNGIDESSRATGSRWGGIRGYWLAEGASLTASRPKFRRISWELHKIAALCYATDELLADAAQFSTVVSQGCAEEIAFMVNDAIFGGDGTGKPLGIMESGALISVAAETNQTADTIVNENLMKMYSRFSGSNPVWYINRDCYPQLHQLSIASGTAALEPRFVNYSGNGSLTIFGAPVKANEFSQTVGDLGDILLADMSDYLFWEKGGIQSASTIHLMFLTDEQVFRFIYRCDGQTAMNMPLTPYNGTSNTVSSFVALAARA